MNETLKQLEQFHGHIGPYAIIGYKMGKIANKLLGTNPFEKQAIIWTGLRPPLSCIIDGIQISSGCTLGKGNITIKNKKTPKAQFTDTKGKKIEITLKSEIQKEIDTTVTEENMSKYSTQLFNKKDEELFEIKK